MALARNVLKDMLLAQNVNLAGQLFIQQRLDGLASNFRHDIGVEEAENFNRRTVLCFIPVVLYASRGVLSLCYLYVY